MKRFEIWLARLDPTEGSEMRKTRPVLIVSPDIMNDRLRTVGLLLQSLYYYLGWRDGHIRDMHNFFEDTGFRADTGASARRWPYSIYSKLVQDEFKLQSKLTNGVRWSEWSVLYI